MTQAFTVVHQHKREGETIWTPFYAVHVDFYEVPQNKLCISADFYKSCIVLGCDRVCEMCECVKFLNLAIIECFKLALLKSYCTISIMSFHSYQCTYFKSHLLTQASDKCSKCKCQCKCQVCQQNQPRTAHLQDMY